MKIVLYPHGGSGNHGCEALVRATCKLLNGNDIRLLTRSPEQDRKYEIEQVCQLRKESEPISCRSLSFLKAYISYHLFKDRDAFESLTYRNLISTKDLPDIALSFGGDNYCYAKPTYIYIMNRLLRKYGVRTVLWGCSIEPSFIDEEMLADLKGYDKIIARESVTYNALLRKGLKNVSCFPDPAFALERVDLPLPKGFVEGNTVGVNVSPMIMSYEKNSGITLKNYCELVRHIIEDTNMNVALIPHVVWLDNDDRQPLKLLYNEFKESGRVVMLGDCTAEELKGYIARCRFMIAARTHASIAAYSQAVPTLVVGYSVKALGIATDLFGTSDGYVIPVQNLRQANDLRNAFDWLAQNEITIRKRYAEFLNSYIDKLKKIII